MAIIANHHPWAFAFGLLGNFVSFMVYLAPLPTFYRVYRKKSTEGFQSIPYMVALLSAMLWMYYAFLKTNGYMLITINSIGCTIEAAYITMFLVYAPREAKIFTMKLLLLLNVGVFGMVLLFTLLFSEGSRRVTIVGWICATFSVSVFAAPLSIIRLVIRTKSVEFMPFSLSFFLTLCAIMWFFYGLLMKDFYVAVPNVLGVTFGTAQMILYIVYKDTKKDVVSESTLPEVDSGVESTKLENLKTNPSDNQPLNANADPASCEKPVEASDLNV